MNDVVQMSEKKPTKTWVRIDDMLFFRKNKWFLLTIHTQVGVVHIVSFVPIFVSLFLHKYLDIYWELMMRDLLQ